MKKWEDFENEMTGYLQQMVKDYDVLVKRYGNADSTVPDIEINSFMVIKINLKKINILMKS